jgi:hypothetical protein
MRRLTSHLRSNVIGYVALFFALSAGAYAASLAPDSVKSKHIKDGHVTNADVAPDAVTGPKVVESTLSEVPNATIAGHGGYGRQSGGAETGASCNPDDELWFTCASVGLTPSAPARFLVTGRFTASVESDDHEIGFGECRLGVSATGGIPGSTVPFRVANNNNATETVTLTAITGVYQPGNYSFGLDCRETDSGEVSASTIDLARVTAVAISPF